VEESDLARKSLKRSLLGFLAARAVNGKRETARSRNHLMLKEGKGVKCSWSS
jgi:hypothetical protein